MKVEFGFGDFKVLEKQLKKLAVPAQTKVLRQAARTAMKPVLEKVVNKIASQGLVDEGELINAVKLRTQVDKNDRKPYDVGATVGVGRHVAGLAWWLEYGTEPHALNTGSSTRQGRIGVSGKKPPKTLLMHPGFEPMPFLRPVLDEEKTAVVDAVGNVLTMAINKAFKK